VFFIIVPEMARLAEEAKCMAGLVNSRTAPQTFYCSCEEKGDQQLTATIENFTNLFSVKNDSAPNTDLYNLVTEKQTVTKVVMFEKTKNDLCLVYCRP